MPRAEVDTAAGRGAASFAVLLGEPSGLFGPLQEHQAAPLEADGSRPWLGELHLVALYDRALGPSEVAQNYEAGIVRE